jgi:hypothetical protein
LKRSVAILYALVSFATFDAAAGPETPLAAVAPDLFRLAKTALDIDGQAPYSS